ncbi:hypothetical protein ACHQM5_026298 [Ranunculus cassubicifolius]
MEMQMQGVEGNGHERQVWIATGHVITTTIWSGVLALPWTVTQLDWIIGPIALFSFAAISYYTSLSLQIAIDALIEVMEFEILLT